MAWRPPRGGGVPAARPRQTNRPTYEDFQPQTETNEEEGARVVVFHVPGFLKENMGITSEQGNNIRVQGQRLLMNNRWSRFNQLVPIPQNCDLNTIRAKYGNGILTITMPKVVPKTALAAPKEDAKKATKENINESLPPKASESKVVPPPSSEPDKKAVAAAEQRAQKDQEQTKDARYITAEENVGYGQRRTPQIVTSTADRRHEMLTEEKKMARSLSPQKGNGELKRQKGGEEENRAKQRDQIGDEKRVVGLTDPQNYTSEPKSKREEETSLKLRDDETRRSAKERLKEQEKAKKVSAPSSGEETPKKDNGETSTSGNKRGVKYAVEAAKQTVTDVVRKLNDDDRRMLINIGAAVLVIVAIGAYVSHSLSSSAKDQS